MDPEAPAPKVSRLLPVRVVVRVDDASTVIAGSGDEVLELVLPAGIRVRCPPAELGEGWVAEEALAIGLYCALVAKDVAHGVLLAVNHGGDSDSTGSICGNILGALQGEKGIPGRWLERLECRALITEVADDLWAHFGEEPSRTAGDDDACGLGDWDKYPGC